MGKKLLYITRDTHEEKITFVIITTTYEERQLQKQCFLRRPHDIHIIIGCIEIYLIVYYSFSDY